MTEFFIQNLKAQNSASPLWASDDTALSVIRTEQDKDALGFAFESIEEIASRFHYSQSKVKMMLKRTRDDLKEYLIKEGLL